jgi:uncharacterized membrane protein
MSETIKNNTDDPKKTIVNVVYVLQAMSFFLGITFIIGLIINYIKRGDARGTWLESHFRWQIRTFWFAFLWSVIGGGGALIGMAGPFAETIGRYFIIGIIILIVSFFWVIYRIIKGWLRLNDKKEMYV